MIKWLRTTKLLSGLRYCVGEWVIRYYQNRGQFISDFPDFQNNSEGLDLIRQIRKETQMLMGDVEALLIYIMVKKAEKIEGDIAEVGVYKGGSAKLICEATQKPVHLFDTFEGLPNLHLKDDSRFEKGDYFSSFEEVKSYLNYPNAYLFKGLFPDSAEHIKDKKFSFVHLDTDVYESTLNSLKFFYPRINSGGVIIGHDYNLLIGVKRAFDEFFKDKQEILIEPPTTSQCLVVKI